MANATRILMNTNEYYDKLSVLVLDLVDICLDNILQTLYKPLLFFEKNLKIDYSKIAKICPVKF